MRKLSIIVLLLAACETSGTTGSADATGDTAFVTDGTTATDGTVSTATSTPPDATVPPDTGSPSDTGSQADSTPPLDTTPPGDTGPGDTNTSNDSGGNDTVTPSGTVGAACSDDAECGANGLCITSLPAGYCSIQCNAAECPGGSSCWNFGDDVGAFCLKDCQSSGECRQGDGYICDGDNTCWPDEGSTNTGDSPVGGACQTDSDCGDAGAFCYPAEFDGEWTGFFEGYCMIPDCSANSCPGGSVCVEVFADGGTACLDSCDGGADGCNQGYGCFEPGLCFPSCASSGCPTNYACDAAEDVCVPSCTADSCPAGTVCRNDGTCGDPPCTPGSCGAGYVCAQSGNCVPDLSGGPGVGPGPTCNNLPPRDCTDGAAACGALVAFEPDEGPGYWDYPINGETTTDEYRSYARVDLMMLIKWATAQVDCKAAGWAGGNGEPLGLGDMSEANGAIPGTREGQPGHPPGTHEDGYDMDIAYYQTAAAPDNRLRAVCPHTSGGSDAYHCTGEPDTLDLWRSALFLGYLLQSPRTRVIGVDGKVGPLVEQAMDVLCGDGWLSGTPCTSNRALAYEVTDNGYGWYRFHHHHLHISLSHLASGAASLPGVTQCLVPSCDTPEGHEGGIWGDGVVRRIERPLSELPRTRLMR